MPTPSTRTPAQMRFWPHCPRHRAVAFSIARHSASDGAETVPPRTGATARRRSCNAAYAERAGTQMRRTRMASASGGQGSQDLLELAAIVETQGEPVLGKALDGTIHSWNAGAEQLYGYSADEIVGKKIDILVPAERVGEIEWILERLRRG